MENAERQGDAGSAEGAFPVYDPDNPPYMKLCICDILSELPELRDEDISGCDDD